ncbi:terminase small subunit [Deinococcus multiflagellatus]|uniref:Terminase small subunit n=1 Tax=Deinococcus multiflagellatus TaxID=1656887 RepID=A0ABW1ZR93_9DEIO|nr:terminase small subunit [Deinococcus multiflagellatus]MBZ9715505.1 terminase small subunit [Deinococcus multiflagellatus]
MAPKQKAPKRGAKAAPREPKVELTPAQQKFEDKLRECSPKERLFVKFKLEKKSHTEAATLAGYSEKTAHVQGSQLLKRLRVWDAYLAGLEANGFGMHDILGDIQDLRTFDRSQIEREIQVPSEEFVARRVDELLPEVQKQLEALRNYVNTQTEVEQSTLELQGERLLALQNKAMDYVERLAINPDAKIVELQTVFVTKRVLCYDLAKQKGLTRFIKSVKPGKYGDVIELYDWVTGVEMGAKALGVYKERHELTGKDGESLGMATVIVLPNNGRDRSPE